MNENDEACFARARQDLAARHKQARARGEDDGDLQADLCELNHDEGVHRFWDSLEE